jgi:hypothetical protein
MILDSPIVFEVRTSSASCSQVIDNQVLIDRIYKNSVNKLTEL